MRPAEYSIACSRVRGGILHPWRGRRASYILPGPGESAASCPDDDLSRASVHGSFLVC